MPDTVTTTAADVTVNKRSIAAVSWGCGRFDTFAIGTANVVYNKHWDDLSDDNSWTSTSLGGDSASPPAAVSHKPHRLDVFVRGQDNAIWNTYYNGKDWSGFRTLGGGFVLTPTAVSWGPDHIDVFGIGTHKAAYRKTYDKGSGWTTSWENLGGDWTSEVAAVSWGPGRIDIFIIGSTYTMYTKAFRDGSWTDWHNLGGTFKSPPTVVSWGEGRLDVFGIGSDGALYHKAFAKGSWATNWNKLGGGLVTAVSAVASSFFGTGRIDIFAMGGGDNDEYYHMSGDGTTFTSWVKHGRSFNCEPAIVSWCPNRLDTFGIGKGDSAMWHQAWNGSEWTPSITGWESAGGKFQNFA